MMIVPLAARPVRADWLPGQDAEQSQVICVEGGPAALPGTPGVDCGALTIFLARVAAPGAGDQDLHRRPTRCRSWRAVVISEVPGAC
jgi:hypothetical protein